MEAIRNIPGIQLHTSLKAPFSGAIGLFSIEGKKPRVIADQLNKDHYIHTVAINWENIHGVRVTPNVYTVTADLDRFIQAIRDIAS